MSEQTKYVAGQLVLGRTTPLWQLVRRSSGKKRRGGRLVAALKDEDGRVVSTPEAAAANVGAKVCGDLVRNGQTQGRREARGR